MKMGERKDPVYSEGCMECEEFIFVKSIFGQISSAAVVSSMELLWPDVKYLVDFLCSHQVLIILHPGEEKQ